MTKRSDITLTAITTTGDVINAKNMMGVIRGYSVETAKAIRVDLQKTVRTWKHKPIFVIKLTGTEEASVSVYTDDTIYAYVTFGTKPHIIRPRNAKSLRWFTPFKAKTRVRFIGSSNGKRGNQAVFAQVVHHPGTEAREFHIVIAEKHQPIFTAGMQRRIDNAVLARS